MVVEIVIYFGRGRRVYRVGLMVVVWICGYFVEGFVR